MKRLLFFSPFGSMSPDSSSFLGNYKLPFWWWITQYIPVLYWILGANIWTSSGLWHMCSTHSIWSSSHRHFILPLENRHYSRFSWKKTSGEKKYFRVRETDYWGKGNGLRIGRDNQEYITSLLFSSCFTSTWSACSLVFPSQRRNNRKCVELWITAPSD